MPTQAEAYQQLLGTTDPDTGKPFEPQKIEAYLRGRQMTGSLRGAALGGEAMLEGAEGTASLLGGLPGRLPQLAGYPPWWTEGDVLQKERGVTDSLGMTNNPGLVPGLGEYPELERLGAGAMRGVGAGLPLAPVAAVAGVPLGLEMAGNAMSGVAAEGAAEAFPNNPLAPVIAGGVMGGLAGGVGAAASRGAAPAAASPGTLRFLLGEGAGAAAAHLGLIPGGDVLGGFMGGLATYYGRNIGNAIARNILHPWVAQGATVGGSAGYATPQELPFNAPPF